MNEVGQPLVRLFVALARVFSALMEPGDWIALLFGVVTAVIAVVAARITWSARQVAAGAKAEAKRSADAAEKSAIETGRSADAAEGSLDVARAQLALNVAAFEHQKKTPDGGDQDGPREPEAPAFSITPAPRPSEVLDLGIVASTEWAIYLEMTAGPTKVKSKVSCVSEVKGAAEPLPHGGTVRTVNFDTDLERGPFEINVGDRFACLVTMLGRHTMSQVEATITVWSDEIDIATGELTGFSWAWVRTVRFGTDLTDADA